LKQARHRASCLFLKEGERSSLPQYLHTNFSAFDDARDDCVGRPAFLALEGGTDFGLALFFWAAGSFTEARARESVSVPPLFLTNALNARLAVVVM